MEKDTRCLELNKIIDELQINNLLEKCGQRYSIRCFSMEDAPEIRDLITQTQKIYKKGQVGRCFTTDTWDMNHEKNRNFYSLVAVNNEGTVISYLSFSIWLNSEGKYDFLLLNDSCTKIDERRRGISMLLRYIPIAYAYQYNFTYVGSDTKNVLSRNLLVSKFGFTDLMDPLDLDFIKFIGREYEGVFANTILRISDITEIENSEHVSQLIYNRLEECSGKYSRF